MFQALPNSIRPKFTGAWINPSPPVGNILESYYIDNAIVRIYEHNSELIYFVLPYEYTASDKFINAVSEFPEKLLAFESSVDISDYSSLSGWITECSRKYSEKDKNLSLEDRKVFPGVVNKYTAGYGILEILFKDQRVQDIFIDAPSTDVITVNISGAGGESGLAKTNVRLSEDEIQAVISRLKFFTKTNFNSRKPVMEVSIPGFAIRATIVGPPLSSGGVTMSFRRRSSNPWTLPMLVGNGTVPDYLSGYLSLLSDAQCSVLTAGARGSGKTSILTAIISEFPSDQRIICIEDTREIPCDDLKDAGIKIISLLCDRNSITAADALKVSLRMGDTAYVMGEVRGNEAKVLYEAMRAGTAGSSVLGTLHADSPESVKTRIINDMGVTEQAFLSTDVIIMMESFRPMGKRRFIRRLSQITEVQDGNLVDIYNVKKNILNLNDSKIIKKAAEKWNVSLEDVHSDIVFRNNIIARLSGKHSSSDIFGSGIKFVVRSRNSYMKCVSSGNKTIEYWEEVMKSVSDRAVKWPVSGN